eukprot:Stramenopile-MAST_4_protein_1585
MTTNVAGSSEPRKTAAKSKVSFGLRCMCSIFLFLVLSLYMLLLISLYDNRGVVFEELALYQPKKGSNAVKLHAKQEAKQNDFNMANKVYSREVERLQYYEMICHERASESKGDRWLKDCIAEVARRKSLLMQVHNEVLKGKIPIKPIVNKSNSMLSMTNPRVTANRIRQEIVKIQYYVRLCREKDKKGESDTKLDRCIEAVIRRKQMLRKTLKKDEMNAKVKLREDLKLEQLLDAQSIQGSQMEQPLAHGKAQSKGSANVTKIQKQAKIDTSHSPTLQKENATVGRPNYQLKHMGQQKHTKNAPQSDAALRQSTDRRKDQRKHMPPKKSLNGGDHKTTKAKGQTREVPPS